MNKYDTHMQGLYFVYFYKTYCYIFLLFYIYIFLNLWDVFIWTGNLTTLFCLTKHWQIQIIYRFTWRRVITKLPNSEQSYKGKVKTKYINRQISQQPENCENRKDPDLVQAFLKKWWVESDFKAPNLPLSLRLKGSGCDYNSIESKLFAYAVFI